MSLQDYLDKKSSRSDRRVTEPLRSRPAITAPGPVPQVTDGPGRVVLLLQPDDETSRYFHPCTTRVEAIKWLKETFVTSHNSRKGESAVYSIADAIGFYEDFTDIVMLEYDPVVNMHKSTRKNEILELVKLEFVGTQNSF